MCAFLQIEYSKIKESLMNFLRKKKMSKAVILKRLL